MRGITFWLQALFPLPFFVVFVTHFYVEKFFLAPKNLGRERVWGGNAAGAATYTPSVYSPYILNDLSETK